MTTEGFDYSDDIPPQVIKNAGAAFVCRYFGYFSGYDLNNIDKKQGKVITPSEARGLANLGIPLVTNFEWYANRPTDGDGRNDAGIAQQIATACGMPSDRPMYFSYDYQTNGSASHEQQYIKDVAATIGLHRTGIYGPFEVVKNYFDMGLISWGWQTYAWSGSEVDPRAHIYQYLNGYMIGNYSLDRDKGRFSDIGQWMPSSGEKVSDTVHIDLDTSGKGVAVCVATPSSGKLVLSSDFGVASVRVALKHREPNPFPWQVIHHIVVDSREDPVVVCDFGQGQFTDIAKASVLVENTSNPGMPVGLDIL